MKKILMIAGCLTLLLLSFTACDFTKKEENLEKEAVNEAEQVSENKEAGIKKKEEKAGKEEREEQATENKQIKEKTKEERKEAEKPVFYQNIKETDVSKGVLMLCNKNYKLPADFEPRNLVPVPDGYYVMDGKDYVLESEVVSAFVQMADAAASEGLNLKVISGYRSEEFQVELYQSYGEAYGYEEADTYSARPRHSEHETGLCMDINMVDQAFQNTEEYTWLMNHGASYGFILRYPEGKEEITGYIYEPWHWRYVGEKAGEIKASGLSFDEYYYEYLE